MLLAGFAWLCPSISSKQGLVFLLLPSYFSTILILAAFEACTKYFSAIWDRAEANAAFVKAPSRTTSAVAAAARMQACLLLRLLRKRESKKGKKNSKEDQDVEKIGRRYERRTDGRTNVTQRVDRSRSEWGKERKAAASAARLLAKKE